MEPAEGAGGPGPAGREPEAVPVEELVDLGSLAPGGRAPSPKAIREALPRGWVLDADGRTARRDARVFFRDSWVLLFGLISFGAAGIGLFWFAFPRGWSGVLRAVVLLGVLLLVGGVIAPMVTRALTRR